MSFLPQRKKSAEEIAELRGSLGIPVQNSADDTAAFADVPPLPKIDHDAFDIKAVEAPLENFSFVPSLAIDEPTAHVPAPEVMGPPKSEPVVAKLTAPESMPEPSAAPASGSADSDGKIPNRKHSPREIEQLRRQIAFTQVEQVYDPRLQKAHPLVVALGYVPVFTAALIAYFYDQSMTVTAPFVGFSLLVALFILIRKPISRHHAGFIFAICFLAIAFGILHYFPQLQHAA